MQFTTVVRHCFTLIFHCVYCRLQRVYSRIHTVKAYLDISINFPLLLYFTMGKANLIVVLTFDPPHPYPLPPASFPDRIIPVTRHELSMIYCVVVVPVIQQLRLSYQERSPKSYKKLATVDLPPAQRVKAADPNVLYRVEVLERDNERVKVHWIGYSDDKDEWIPANSLTTLDSSQECKSGGVLHLEHYFPSISMALTAGTRDDVDVKIELLFDPRYILEGRNN